jgi:hypothetical protein
MATTTGAFDDIDPKTESKADHGVSASRKVRLTSYEAPLFALAAHGIEVPHRDFDPEGSFEYPTTVHIWDGPDGWQTIDPTPYFDHTALGEVVTVHLHQDVREDMDDEFGVFGSLEDDDEDVVWTVVGLDDGTVNLTVVGDWGRRREVPYAEFAEDYEPLHLTDGQPRWGY